MSHSVVSLLVFWLPGIPPMASHTLTSWSEPVTSSSPAMLQFSSRFGDESVRSMIEWLFAPAPALVGFSDVFPVVRVYVLTDVGACGTETRRDPLIAVSRFAHSYSQLSVIARVPGTSGSVGTCVISCRVQTWTR